MVLRVRHVYGGQLSAGGWLGPNGQLSADRQCSAAHYKKSLIFHI